MQAPNVFLDALSAKHDLSFTSAYKEYCSVHPTHASAHDVQTEFAGVIDQIFFQPESYRATRVGKIMRSIYAVPNERDPSDHVPVAVTLEFFAA